MGLIENFMAFKQTAQAQNPNLNPEVMSKNMLGNQNISTPQEALDYLLQCGKINQQTYDAVKKMI